MTVQNHRNMNTNTVTEEKTPKAVRGADMEPGEAIELHHNSKNVCYRISSLVK